MDWRRLFISHDCGCCALYVSCSSSPQVILGDGVPEIYRPLLAAFEEGLWPSSASSAAPHATPALSSFRRSFRNRTLYLTARELFPESARSVPSAVAAGSARSSSGTPRATGGGTPRASLPRFAAAAAALSRPEPVASAREQWEFWAGTAESPGPWADAVRTLYGGRGLTALRAPQSERLPGLLSFVGLESIKQQQAVNFVQVGAVRG